MNANPMAHRSVEIPKRSSGWRAGRLSAARLSRLSMTMDLQALGLFRWRGRNAAEGEEEEEEEEEITWDFTPLELVPQRRPVDEISDVTSASTEELL